MPPGAAANVDHPLARPGIRRGDESRPAAAPGPGAPDVPASGGRRGRSSIPRFTTFNKHMLDAGVALDGEMLTAHPELLTGWPTRKSMRTAMPPGSHNKAAVIAHVYYEDTWTDIAEALKRVTIPFDLIVTTNPGRERFVECARADFPDADIEVVENRGRDLRPFLSLLERVVLIDTATSARSTARNRSPAAARRTWARCGDAVSCSIFWRRLGSPRPLLIGSNLTLRSA
jgi:hypothetical protein